MKALITGITGQDGSYLAEYLLSNNYEVHGIIRRSSVFTTQRVEHLFSNPNFYLHHGDVNDSSNLTRIVAKLQPNEIYHLAAQTHVGVSFEVPEYTGDVTGLGTLRLLNAIKEHSPESKFYNASTSEIFGGNPHSAPQNEKTPFTPKSPYGVAKLYSYWITRNYRESFGLFASNGILFNHESPRRGETFVTRKISKGVADIIKKRCDEITLGNLNSVRDWGFAKDYVVAMHKILLHKLPDDYVIATGRGATVREFANMAFRVAGIELEWQGNNYGEVAIDSKSGKVVVKIDSRYFRPSEVEVLIGNPQKAKTELSWTAHTNLEQLCQIMVEHDLRQTY